MELTDLNFFRLLMSTSFDQRSKICFFFGFSFQTGLKNLCEFVLTNYNANQFRLKLIDIVHFAWTFVLMMDSEKL